MDEIPGWHDPAEPCPDWPHYNQSTRGDHWLAVGCSRCNVGWKWGPYDEPILDGKPLLKWLQRMKRYDATAKHQPSQVIVEPLMEDEGG